MLSMIDIQNLTKTYGAHTVLRDITIRFEDGHIVGLVGANGCGKTTLMRCICGFSQPTAGYVIVNGCLVGGKGALRRNPSLRQSPSAFTAMADFAPSTGVIIESPGFLANETGLRNLLLLADMSGKVGRYEARHAMMKMGLDPDEKKPVGKYSLGQRQRLGFAQALMENPDVLILDEPFNAMDRESMEDVHGLLQLFKGVGKTIILASHSVWDIEKACDVVYEMEDGGLKMIRQPA